MSRRTKDSALSNEQLANLDVGDTVIDPSGGTWIIHVADHNGVIALDTDAANHEVVAARYRLNVPYMVQLLNARNSVGWRITHQDEPTGP